LTNKLKKISKLRGEGGRLAWFLLLMGGGNARGWAWEWYCAHTLHRRSKRLERVAGYTGFERRGWKVTLF